MSHRLEQIASTLKRTLSQLLVRGMNDPRLEGVMVSITEVKVSPDMHWAEVYVSILPDTAQSKAIHALRHAARHLQAQARKGTALRVVPKLDFRLDESIKRQAAIFSAIHEGLQRSGPAAEEAGPDEPDADEPATGPETPEEKP